IVSIDVSEPSGVDAQALTWAREHDDSPLSWSAVKVFPSSYYAALALLPYIDIGKAVPGKVKTEIERGRFLAWGSVPDSDTPDGWASLSGSELAGAADCACRTRLAGPPEGPVCRMAQACNWRQRDCGREGERGPQATPTTRRSPRDA